MIRLLASRPQRSSVGDPYVAPIFVLGCGIGFLLGGLWVAGLYRSRAGEVFEVHEVRLHPEDHRGRRDRA